MTQEDDQKQHVIGNKLEDLSKVAQDNKMTIGQLLTRAIKGELTEEQIAQLDNTKGVKRGKQ